MLFNSYYFVLFFLPAVLVLYYLAHRGGMHKGALVILSLASFVFYAYDNVYYLVLLAGSILLNWTVCAVLYRYRRKWVMWLGILADIGVIFYFKYYDFFIENVNVVCKTGFTIRNIMLPLGISFFTFQQISFLVDTYRGETEGISFCEYVAFVSFFPQLVAGPIVLHKELIPQYRDERRWHIDAERFADGLYVFGIGMFKKVMIADRFGEAVSYGWQSISSLNSLEMFLVSIFYTFQLYFDFSGYCDMAIGISKLFGLDLPVNFNSPYKAVSIGDFWKRWHMTLTRFFTNYIYIPLGGNRNGKVRTYVNIMVVFLVCGIWHGANWTFIVWGLLHGFFQVLNRIFRDQWNKVPKVLAWLSTFVIVDMLWVMFYAPSVSEAITAWKKILSFSGVTVSEGLSAVFVGDEMKMILEALDAPGLWLSSHSILFMFAFTSAAFIISVFCKNLHEDRFQPSIFKSVSSALLFLWAVLSFSGVSTFLYSNF